MTDLRLEAHFDLLKFRYVKLGDVISDCIDFYVDSIGISTSFPF